MIRSFLLGFLTVAALAAAGVCLAGLAVAFGAVDGDRRSGR
jgi:hypothetical protein